MYVYILYLYNAVKQLVLPRPVAWLDPITEYQSQLIVVDHNTNYDGTRRFSMIMFMKGKAQLH